jgi:asparagine synthase (glutamine-hydrolysing)
MSALAGIWNFDGNPGAGEACARMLAAQAIYGPHDNTQWNAGAIALGRRLFRTLPEDAYDRQPLSGGGGRYTLVADLRLDNRDDLIRDLQIPPERARTLADAAILLAAWERWQEACFEHLVGDYAFALWDESENRLVLARDALGQRPLHYHRRKNFLAFASMPKGLHAVAEIPRAPDEERIAEFLALLPESGSQSFFKDIERVEAGHFAVITAGGVTARRHWEPRRRTIRLGGAEDYAEGLRHHLDEAVRARLRGSNGVVGAHLSSGFDSSAVTTSAARILAPSGGKVVAFTSVPRQGYDGPSPPHRIGDEGPIAAKTAALYPNIEHVLIRTNGRSPLDSLDRNFFLYDRPMLNLCNNVWVDAINDAARERKLNVMLSGQFGNMSISYDGTMLLPRLMRRGQWIRWFRESSGAVRRRNMRWRGVLVATFGPYMPLPMWIWVNKVFSDRNVGVETYSAIRAERLAQLDLPARARALSLDLSYRPRKDGFESRLWVLRRVDLGNYNKGVLGGWGIDPRDPTADIRLIEFCLAVPEEQYFVNGEAKALARRAFAARLPPEVIHIKGKGYQAVDWHEGLTAARGAVGEEIARLGECAPAAAAIDLPRLAGQVENWPQGGWEKDEVMAPYRLALLRAVSTGHFLRKASGSNA